MRIAAAAERATRIASHSLQSCRVQRVTHGSLNVTIAPRIDAAMPTMPLVKSSQVGATRTSSNFSGNARFTRNMSAKSNTIEIHQITVTAAWKSQKILLLLLLPNHGPNAATVSADARTVWTTIAFTGTFVFGFTRASAVGIRRSRPDTKSSRLNELL